MLQPRRPGEERNTRRYVHPPSVSPDEIGKGYLRHIPIGSRSRGRGDARKERSFQWHPPCDWLPPSALPPNEGLAVRDKM